MSLLKTPPGRCSFPHLFEPSRFENQKPKYSVGLCFPPREEMNAAAAKAYDEMERRVEDLRAQKFKEKKFGVHIRSPFETITEDNASGRPIGWTSAKFKSFTRPDIFDSDATPLTDPTRIYGGCWLVAGWTLYSYDVSGNKGIGLGLTAAQFVKNDEAFGVGSTKITKADLEIYT